MRFAIAAALFAGAVMAHGGQESTVYQTSMVTVTSCGAEVTNCPADSTKVYSTVVPHTTSTIYSHTVVTVTSCGPEVTNCPASSTVAITQSKPVSKTLVPVETHGYGNSSAVFPTGSAKTCAGYSVKTISTSVTTVIPTVIYETVSVPCTTSTTAKPTGTGYASHSTAVPATTSAVFTGGAANVGVSMIAAAAGIMALLA